MSKTTVYNQIGEKVKDLELAPDVFGVEVKSEVIQHAVVVQQANARHNIAHAKGRSEVSGGGKKPWRQKGTGRARHGSSRSPIWKGGGVTFGPSKVQNYSLKINKKARRKAILMGLSDKAAHDNVILLDTLAIKEAKTKNFFEILQNLELRNKSVKKTAKVETKSAKDGSAPTGVASHRTSGGKKDDKDIKVGSGKKLTSILVVLPKKDEKIRRAAHNIVRVNTILADSLNVVDVVKSQKLLIPVDSIEVIQKTFVSSYAKVPVSVKATADKSGDKK